MEASFRLGVVGDVADAALARVAGLVAGGTQLRLVHEAGREVPAGWEGCAVGGPGSWELVVRHADVLAAGAGQEDAVALALELGMAVLLVGDGSERLLTSRHWAVSSRPAPEGEAAWAGLGVRIGAVLAVPEGAAPEVLGAVEAGRRLRALRIWRAHRVALELLSRTPLRAPSKEAGLGWWSALYGASDALANGYADRYRSSYTIVLALAAVAGLVAVMGLGSHHHWPFVVPEFAALAGIAVLVWLNARLDWRARLIQCRLLAELCRKQAALAFVGRSLPSARIAGVAGEGALSWIAWRFAAAVRASPVPGSVAEGAALAAAREQAAAVLLRGQIEYHEGRAALGRLRERRLVVAGSVLFFATVALVVAKMGLLIWEQEEWVAVAGLWAALLPTGAAALFGFRAYAELELLVQQSERMVEVLQEAAGQLAEIDPLRAGAARAVGDVLEETAEEMLADVSGWIQISQVKAVEAG